MRKTRGKRGWRGGRGKKGARREDVNDKGAVSGADSGSGSESKYPTTSDAAACEEMCPAKEASRRVAALPFEPPYVKRYTRRAALGLTKEAVRTPDALCVAHRHLIDNIIGKPLKTKVSFISLYNFIADRFQSIRQDRTISKASSSRFIPVLEQQARFLALSLVKLRAVPESHFSVKLCLGQLGAVLASLFDLYSVASNTKHRGEFAAMRILLSSSTNEVSNLIAQCPQTAPARAAAQIIANRCMPLLLLLKSSPLLCQLADAKFGVAFRAELLDKMNRTYLDREPFPIADVARLLRTTVDDSRLLLAACGICADQMDDQRVRFRCKTFRIPEKLLRPFATLYSVGANDMIDYDPQETRSIVIKET